MSIPPLVCNTPPPIDQCDDDKDQEDFDIRYNLSQEDDDSNEYDCNDFSSYINKSASDKQEDLPKINDEMCSHSHNPIALAPNTDNENPTVTDQDINPTHLKIKIPDEVNLEDLDLKLDRVSINSDKDNQVENNNDKIEEIETKTDLSEEFNIESEEAKEATQFESGIEEDLLHKDEKDDPRLTEDLPKNLIQNDSQMINIETDVVQETDLSSPVIKVYQEENIKTQLKKPSVFDSDEEFGDFDDFKMANTNQKFTIPVDDQENPWSGQESKRDNMESHFEASFGDFTTAQEATAVTESKDLQNDDDDFGDFDDFQSTSVHTSDSKDQRPVINLIPSVSDETIEKVIFSIFAKDESDMHIKFESKLESFLSDTWRHLKETDIRQPYLVNWNSSTAQKTLLKALCIDSRNILFGPKWAHSMQRPQYVNLGPAPLQPQKPATTGESLNPNKSSSKLADAWVDPFTSPGQEFTYAEALLLDLEQLMATLDQVAHGRGRSAALNISDLLAQHACSSEERLVVEPAPRPRDLNIAPTSAQPKKEEVYSAVLNIQPMRQISLPDTHIFTPTDSETPRSKTIHYHNSPTIIRPEKPIDKHASDFSDFQDFREALGDRTQISKSKLDNDESASAPAGFTSREINILEPIKMEPIVPKLNWPDPGHVKETFEDFSDFISNSSWNSSDSKNIAGSSASNISNAAVMDLPNVSNKSNPKQVTNIIQNNFDDDFESFQSAIPTSYAGADSPASRVPRNSETPPLQKAPSNNEPVTMKTDLDFVFTVNETNSQKSNNISPLKTAKSTGVSTNILPVNNSVISSPGSTENKANPHSTLGQSFTNQILQPISTGLSAVQGRPNTTQILQPLSLEGYSQINWPDPGVDLQDLSRFNPVEKLPSLQGDTGGGGAGAGGASRHASPARARRAPAAAAAAAAVSPADDDLWGEFVSSRPKARTPTPKKHQTFVEDDEWTDFVSSSSVKPTNGLNTISFNVHSNSSSQKLPISNKYNTSQKPMDIPTLNYITPKTSSSKAYAEKHIQNL